MEFALGESNVETVTDYDERTDSQSVKPVDELFSMVLQSGMFAVFFPNEFHKPTCFVHESVFVRKAVLKAHSDLLLPKMETFYAGKNSALDKRTE